MQNALLKSPEDIPLAPMDWRAWARVALLALLWNALLAFTRNIDGDEGYLLYAARLAMAGQLPYRDFFFPQMPFLPYLLGAAAIPLGGLGWLSARALCAAQAALCAAAMAWLFRKAGLRGKPWLIALGLYFISDLGFVWAVTVKTLIPPIALLLLAHGLLQTHGGKGLHARALWLAGLFAGLAIGIRWTVAPAAALILLAPAAAAQTAPQRAKRAGWVALGLALPLAAIGWFALQAPRAFYMDNYYYHTLGVAKTGLERAGYNLAQFLAVVFSPAWLASLGLIALKMRAGRWRRADSLCLACALWFCVVGLIPVRAFSQYFCMATPWLLLAAASEIPLALDGFKRRTKPGARRSILTFAAIYAGAYLVAALVLFWPVLLHRWKTHAAIESYNWRFSTILRVEARLTELARPGEAVVAWWPGYAIQSQARLWPGLENQFGLYFDLLARPEQLKGLKIMRAAELRALLARREPRLIVTGNFCGVCDAKGSPFYEALIQANGYRVADQIGEAKIYVRP